jgi:uncharacterized protein
MPRIPPQRFMLSVKISLLVIFSIVLLHTQGVAEGNKRACLWKLKSEKNTVYILGSIHLLKKDAYPLAQTLERAFDDSQAVVLEIAPDAMTQERVQKLFLSKGLYGDKESLKGNVTEATYEFVRKRTEELGLDIERFNRFKPWLLGLTLAVVKLQKLGLDPEYGIDKYFFDKAKKAGKEVISLETAEYQIDLFDGMSASLEEELLLQTLRDLDVMEKEIDRIVAAWASRDTATLETTLLKSLREYPEVYNKLLKERNKNWLPIIERLIGQEKNYLVVVGVGHLIGADSLISLLKGKGYSLDQ